MQRANKSAILTFDKCQIGKQLKQIKTFRTLIVILSERPVAGEL